MYTYDLQFIIIIKKDNIHKYFYNIDDTFFLRCVYWYFILETAN